MENYKVILCGKLYDGLSDVLQEQMEILVKGNQIIEVDKNVAKPAGTETIDLSHLTVTPGLIDAHVHYGTGNWKVRRHETIYENPQWKGMAVLYNARKALRRGFTAARHVEIGRASCRERV